MTSPRPVNIVCIVVDDLGVRDLSAAGSTFYETPRIDALAAEGVVCEQAYASAPVCSPTRASLMTGRTPARVGMTNHLAGNRRGPLREAPFAHRLSRAERTIAAELISAGYQTWHVGKWHLGGAEFGPRAHGFEANVGGGAFGHPPQGYWSPWGLPDLEDTEPGDYLTDRLTDEAIDLVRTRDRGRPFFLNLWHYGVHSPFQAPQDLVEKYRAKATELGLDQENPFQDTGELEVLPLDPGEPMERGRRRLFQSDPVYAAMVENLDTNIGRLLDALAEEELDEDTLILFTSDNGGLATGRLAPTSNLPFAEGKGWDREGGVRVFQAARWPRRIAPGSRSATPTWSCDLFPTFLSAAGLPTRPELHVDGIDMMGIWGGEEPAPQRPLFWHYPHYGDPGGTPASWVLEGGWKLVHRYGRTRDELFHLDTDISEVRDRSAAEPERAASLRARLDAWLEEVEANVPVADPDYERLRALVPGAAPRGAPGGAA